MDAHPALTLTVYIVAIAVALLVILYWIAYTRRLKTPRNSGTEAGIAVATHDKERRGKTGSV